MKLALLITIVCGILLTIRHASADLGDDKEKCNDQYGEEISDLRHGDKINAQNFTAMYGRAPMVQVTYNRKLVAIELKFYTSRFPDDYIQSILARNGTTWKKDSHPLGSAMTARKMDRWKSAEGNIAEREAGNAGEYLRLFSVERLAQFAENRLKESPKP